MADPQSQRKMEKLTQIVENLEEIQYTHIELTDQRRARVNDSLEKLNHKLHTLSNLYMAMEEKLNELGQFTTQLEIELNDLRESFKSISDRSDADSAPTTQ